MNEVNACGQYDHIKEWAGAQTIGLIHEQLIIYIGWVFGDVCLNVPSGRINKSIHIVTHAYEHSCMNAIIQTMFRWQSC